MSDCLVSVGSKLWRFALTVNLEEFLMELWSCLSFFLCFPVIRAMPKSSMNDFIFRSVARRKDVGGPRTCCETRREVCVIKKTSNLAQLPLLVNSLHAFRLPDQSYHITKVVNVSVLLTCVITFTPQKCSESTSRPRSLLQTLQKRKILHPIDLSLSVHFCPSRVLIIVLLFSGK